MKLQSQIHLCVPQLHEIRNACIAVEFSLVHMLHAFYLVPSLYVIFYLPGCYMTGLSISAAMTGGVTANATATSGDGTPVHIW